MAQQPAAFHHVPSLSELAGSSRDAHGDEAAARWAATGGTLDLPDAAAYAVHQIDLARSALARLRATEVPTG